MPQATQADPQHIQELEQRLQQHQSDAISIDQQVGFAASQLLCNLPYCCAMPLECLCTWHDCSEVVLPAGGHKCTVHLKHKNCFFTKQENIQLGICMQWCAMQLCTPKQANL